MIRASICVHKMRDEKGVPIEHQQYERLHMRIVTSFHRDLFVQAIACPLLKEGDNERFQKTDFKVDVVGSARDYTCHVV